MRRHKAEIIFENEYLTSPQVLRVINDVVLSMERHNESIKVVGFNVALGKYEEEK